MKLLPTKVSPSALRLLLNMFVYLDCFKLIMAHLIALIFQ